SGGGGTNLGTLVALDQTTGAITNELTLGQYPTDFAIDLPGDFAYAVNYTENTITKIDLESFSIVTTKNVGPAENPPWSGARIKTGRTNQVYYRDGARLPVLHVFDFESGTDKSIFDFLGNGIGNFAVTKDSSTIFMWSLFGFGTGWSYLARIDSQT